MQEYIGIDLHKRTAVIVKKNRRGKVTEKVTVPTTARALTRYFARQDRRSRVVVEATGNWMFLYETIEQHTPDIQLAHPLKTRAIAEARIKTDSIDAGTLAELLRLDGIPAAYIPPRPVRDARELLRHRAALVAVRTATKNRIHAVLTKNGIACAWSDVLGKRARAWLRALEVRPAYRQALDDYLRLGELLTIVIGEVTTTVEQLVAANPGAQLLMTMPGVSYYSALLILSEIGEVARFANAKRLCSYAGLVPRVYSSGGRTYYGHITKQGSRWLRWICVELTTHLVNRDRRFRSLYQRVSRKHGRATARVAVARKALTVIYAMLKHGQPFEARRSRQRLTAAPWSGKRAMASGHPPYCHGPG
jgi:transposase